MLRGVMRGTIVALLLTACTTAMHFRVIDKGAYGDTEATKPSVTVTKGAKESTIRLELGKRPTGGWAIEPLDVSGDPSLAIVKTKIVEPAGGLVTMAFTAPYAVIAVDAEVKKARWIDENGNVIAEAK